MTVLDDIGTSISTAAATAAPSVVRIGSSWRGCGVVLADGVVATSAHNLRGHETTITLPDGSRVTATLAGADVDGDLAVLRVDTAGTTPITWADGPPDLGQPVVALGGGPSPSATATLGFVSGTDHAFRGPHGRRVTGAFAHTAPLPRGSSGGPVVDLEGRLVGIDTHRLGEGFYLAVPADADLRRRLDALAAGEQPRRFHLGVALAPARVARHLRRQVGLPERDGLLVRHLVADAPAARADIQPGDLIVGAAGQPVGTADDLHAALDAVGDDERLTLTIVRGVDELEVVVGFGADDGVEATT